MNDLSSQTNLHLAISPRPRVAILVDGDNVPHSALAGIEANAATLGNPILRRVYGDMALHKDWAADTDYLTIHCTTTAGKNRADILLVIGALDIAHRGLATHFLIMSDDRDFGPLVAHLSEIGMRVEWAGKPKPVPKPIAAPPPGVKPKALTDVNLRLRKILEPTPTGLSLQAIGSQMKDYGTVKAQTKKLTWRAYLKSKPDLYTLNGASAATIVTLKARQTPNSLLPLPRISID